MGLENFKTDTHQPRVGEQIVGPHGGALFTAGVDARQNWSAYVAAGWRRVVPDAPPMTEQRMRTKVVSHE